MLHACHRRAPFLFFNGNTFAEIGRALATALFGELPALRRKEVASAIAHYITGVLDRATMAAVVRSLTQSASLAAGDRVKTLRGSLRGVITRVLEDGRLSWRPDGATTDLMALPESLMADGCLAWRSATAEPSADSTRNDSACRPTILSRRERK